MSLGSMRRAVLGLAVLGLVSGCGAFERWACGEPCDAPTYPPEGSVEDFTRAGLEDATISVSEAIFCETVDGEDIHTVAVTTRGSPDGSSNGTWVRDRLLPALSERDIVPGHGIGQCPHPDDDDGLSYALITQDWTDVDPIVDTIHDLARQDDVGIELVITIEPVFGSCPDEACGV